MKVYAISEDVPYGMYIHIIRAKNRGRAKTLAKHKMSDNGSILQTCEISSKGKEGYIFYDGFRE